MLISENGPEFEKEIVLQPSWLHEGEALEGLWRERLDQEGVPWGKWRLTAVLWEQDRIKRDFPDQLEKMPHLFVLEKLLRKHTQAEVEEMTRRAFEDHHIKMMEEYEALKEAERWNF